MHWERNYDVIFLLCFDIVLFFYVSCLVNGADALILGGCLKNGPPFCIFGSVIKQSSLRLLSDLGSFRYWRASLCESAGTMTLKARFCLRSTEKQEGRAWNRSYQG